MIFIYCCSYSYYFLLLIHFFAQSLHFDEGGKTAKSARRDVADYIAPQYAAKRMQHDQDEQFY